MKKNKFQKVVGTVVTISTLTTIFATPVNVLANEVREQLVNTESEGTEVKAEVHNNEPNEEVNSNELIQNSEFKMFVSPDFQYLVGGYPGSLNKWNLGNVGSNEATFAYSHNSPTEFPKLHMTIRKSGFRDYRIGDAVKIPNGIRLESTIENSREDFTLWQRVPSEPGKKYFFTAELRGISGAKYKVSLPNADLEVADEDEYQKIEHLYTVGDRYDNKLSITLEKAAGRDRALEITNISLAEVPAEYYEAVALFTDESYSKLNRTVTQEQLVELQAKVDKLPKNAVFHKIQELLDKAHKIYTETIVTEELLGNHQWLIDEVNRQLSPYVVGKNVYKDDLNTIKSIDVKGKGITGLDGMTLHLDTKKPDGSSEKGTFTGVDLTTDASTIISLDKSDIRLSDTVTTADLNATLNIPKSIAANTYSGTIVWNAIDGAPA